MSNENRVSAVLAAADKTSIIQKLTEIRALLPFLVNLTDLERKRLARVGDQTIGWEEKCQTYMEQQPSLVPSFVDVAELQKDRDLRLDLNDLRRQFHALAESLDDTEAVVAHEIYHADLSFYQNLRLAKSRGVPEAGPLYDDLATRYPGQPRKKVTPTPPPSP